MVAVKNASTAEAYSPVSRLISVNKMKGLEVRTEMADLERIGELADKWRSLAAENPSTEPFFQPEWFAAYSEAFERKTPILLTTVWNGSKLRGVLPMIEKKKFFKGIPASTFKSLSGLHSCRFDLVHGAKDIQETAEIVWESLKLNRGWEVLEISGLPEDAAFERILVRAEREGFYVGRWPTRKSPFLSLSPNASDPFANCPERTKKARSRLKNYQKKLEAQGEYVFQVTTTADRKSLDKFYALEASGWKGKAGSAIAQHPHLRQFYDNIAASAASRNGFRLYSLLSGSSTVAMEYGLMMKDRYYSPKAAYNEAFKGFSPGHLLVRHIIRDLWSHGVKEYDFLGPMAWYKSVWAAKVRQHNDIYIFRPGLKGWLLYNLTMKVARMVRSYKYRVLGDPQAF